MFVRGGGAAFGRAGDSLGRGVAAFERGGVMFRLSRSGRTKAASLPAGLFSGLGGRFSGRGGLGPRFSDKGLRECSGGYGLRECSGKGLWEGSPWPFQAATNLATWAAFWWSPRFSSTRASPSADSSEIRLIFWPPFITPNSLRPSHFSVISKT